jgi:hypothetical protein
LDDLDLLARLARKVRWVARDHAHRFAAVQHMRQNLMADIARRGGDDNHVDLLCRVTMAMVAFCSDNAIEPIRSML